MRIFVTGASGFIGSAVVQDLLRSGHQVLGLARSDESAAALTALGVEVQRGSLDDLESLTRGAQAADGVIHTAYKHDFFRGPAENFYQGFVAAAETDRLAVETLGLALAGSNKPLVMVTGTAVLPTTHTATEADEPDPNSIGAGRIKSELTALSMVEKGVRAIAVRLPPTVHGNGDHHGFIPGLIKLARERGMSAYVGDGNNCWPAVHRLDAAVLLRLAAEKAPAGSRLNAVAEEGVPTREIAAVIGEQLQLPVVSIPSDQANEHFAWMAHFIALNNRTSSKITRELLGWHSTQPDLIADLQNGSYFGARVA